jgi:bisphosphoglycerate-dependent phosphoglycerate mutase
MLRHGQSDWNARNLFTGWMNVPLTEAGESGKRYKLGDCWLLTGCSRA